MKDRPAPPEPAAVVPPPGRGQRLALVAGIVALTVALSGFFMGLRHTADVSARQRAAWASTIPPAPPSARPSAPASSTAIAPPTAAPAPIAAGSATTTETTARIPEAPLYRQLATHTLRPNRDWQSHLADLPRPTQALRPIPLTLEQEEILRRQRAARRQYDGAPPVAPHPINQTTPAACLECHGRPTFISGIAVPQMSHALYPNCLQCHAPAGGPTSTWRSRELSPAEGNAFQGRPPPGHGHRAYLGAPPIIPHSTWMRQNCLSCHGPAGTAALRTSHPERPNCLQCHATEAAAEQRPPLFAQLTPGAPTTATALPPPLVPAPAPASARPPPLPAPTRLP